MKEFIVTVENAQDSIAYPQHRVHVRALDGARALVIGFAWTCGVGQDRTVIAAETFSGTQTGGIDAVNTYLAPIVGAHWRIAQ